MTDLPKEGEEKPGRGLFFKIRVTLLLGVLALVLLYAWHDVTSRRARTSWDHTLEIAVVVLRRDAVDPEAIRLLEARLHPLEERMTEELHRYRPDAPPPFAFRFFGPVDVEEDPPSAEGDGIVDLATHAYRLSRYLARVDDTVSLPSRAYDARIYVTAKRPRRDDRTLVEGVSEEGGRVGNVTVELDDGMADFALAVVGHELFHTLGATDKYDPAGHPMIPEGLAEPDREPRFPQRFVEIMTRSRPLGGGAEQIPEAIDDLAVGPTTAKEIGWAR